MIESVDTVKQYTADGGDGEDKEEVLGLKSTVVDDAVFATRSSFGKSIRGFTAEKIKIPHTIELKSNRKHPFDDQERDDPSSTPGMEALTWTT